MSITELHDDYVWAVLRKALGSTYVRSGLPKYPISFFHDDVLVTWNTDGSVTSLELKDRE